MSRPYIGGQALLEGVMMRAPKSFAVVVRRSDGSLHVRERAMHEGARGIARWPLVRGVASVVESLKLGSEALRFSVEQMEEDLAARDAAGDGGAKKARAGLGLLSAFGFSLFTLATGDGTGPHLSGVASARPNAARDRAGTWLMLAVAVAFFVAIPQAAAAGFSRILGLGLEVQSAPFQAMTGAFKLAVVVGYLLAIRRVPDIRRVFQYHGAEHKTITTYEAGDPLTVDSARPKTTMHPRCGTTFLVMVALVSIGVFTAVGATLPRIHTGSALLDNAAFFFEKLPFLPVIAAVTFELQRLLARHCTTGPLRALLWPGFLVQKITTAEPSDDQLEVALASLRVTLFRQEKGHVDASENDVSFESYGALLAADRLRLAA
ncbi:MAG TPA: DUF1385 domain-containing protein [Polyangiaceae bacterium]|nr:DUF1385 domain-containing protein [Polyangiaceae bacterium]